MPRQTIEDKLLRQFEVLCDINREMNSKSELKPLLESIAENSARLLDADAVSVMLYDHRTASFRTFAGWKSWHSNEPAVIFSLHEGIIGRVASRLQGVLVGNPALDSDFKPNPDASLPAIQSMMCVPLLAGAPDHRRLIGVINCSRRDLPQRTAKPSFAQDDLILFEKFSDTVTAAIQRSEVYEETRRRTLLLQILNEVGNILSSAMEKPENFQPALNKLVEGMQLSHGQLVVFRNSGTPLSFSTPAPGGGQPAAGRSAPPPPKKTKRRGVPSIAGEKGYFKLESNGRHVGYLYLRALDETTFQDETNWRMLETVRDQFAVSVSNFLLLEELRQSKLKLEELNQMKNELISIVSHDFRSPLTVIHAYSELLMIHPDIETQTRNEYLHSIFEQIGHLRRLADGALKITRIESGEMIYSFERVHFRTLMEQFTTRRSPLHRLRIKEQKNLPPLRADSDRLFEIMDNLISNAIKYSPKGGDINIQASHKGDFVEIQVRDRGMGIPAAQISHLFNKYYRIHNDQTKHIRGTGLGLYICKKMIEAHGGRIGVQSKPDQGSLFYFTIPVYREDEPGG